MTRRDARFFGLGAAAAVAVALAIAYCSEPSPEASPSPSPEPQVAEEASVAGEEPVAPDADLVAIRMHFQWRDAGMASPEASRSDAGEGDLAADAAASAPPAQDQARSVTESDDRLLGTHSTAVWGVSVEHGASLVSETAGAVVGRVRLRDAPSVPPPQVVTSERTETDKFCKAHWKPQSPVQVNSHGQLANALVRLSWGMDPMPGPERTFEVTVRDCALSQALAVAVPGQSLRFTNRDPVPHDLTSWAPSGFDYKHQDLRGLKSGASTEIRAKEVRNSKLGVVFGGSIDLAVVPHPYWSVTGSFGEFALPQVPPGTYTVTAWHPRLGKKDQLVIVQANHQTRIDFDYSGSDLRR